METGGSKPAGSGRTNVRLDPFALPHCFPAYDAGADGEIRQVKLNHEKVVLRRAVGGIPMTVSVPVEEFRGVTFRLVSFGDDSPKTIAIVLEHRDPSLSVPLHIADDSEDPVLVCKAWSRVLRRPLLTEPGRRPQRKMSRLGSIVLGVISLRRHRRAALRQRRPSILSRRKPGAGLVDASVHSGEREIIARTRPKKNI